MFNLINTIIANYFSRKYFKKEWIGEIRLPEKNYRLVYFSHFDEQGEIKDYVIHYLNELVKNKCIILFVSTSPLIQANYIEKIKPLCFRIILRENIGLDFGSWRMASDRYPQLLNKASGLYLLNDSCIGPFFNIERILNGLENKGTLSGITINYEVSKHIQSYFLFIPRELLFKFYIKKFLPTVQYFRDKNEIINKLEIGLSKMAIQNNIELFAWVDNEKLQEIDSKVDKNKNLTIWYCDILLISKFSPFVKRAVFKDSSKLIPEQRQRVVKAIQEDYAAFYPYIEKYL